MTKTYQDILNTVDTFADLALADGLSLVKQDSIMDQQKSWDSSDKLKQFNFALAPYWLIPDNGVEPIAIHDAKDLEEHDINQNWLN